MGLGFTKAFDLNANSIIITDVEGIIVYANPHFYEVTGFTPQEVLGQNPRIIKHEGSTIMVNYYLCNSFDICKLSH